MTESADRSTPAKRSHRASVLVVEDDPSTAGLLTELLEANGYQVWAAENGSIARTMLDDVRPDLIILDLMLPDVDGLVLCGDLRARLNVPIIVCSGANRKWDNVLSLRLGADDFVSKPFDIYDLEARIEAVLRRSSQATPTPSDSEPEYRVGELRIDRSRRHVTLGGEQLQLTPTEYRLLSTMATRPDEVFSRDELAQKVWGYQDASSGRAIDVHIRRLRVKLDSGPVPPPPIVSVRGFGYKLTSGAQQGVSSVA